MSFFLFDLGPAVRDAYEYAARAGYGVGTGSLGWVFLGMMIFR